MCTPQPPYYTTTFSGAKRALPQATYLKTAPGCFDIFCGECTTAGPAAPPPCINRTDFGPAVEAAGQARDLVVYVGGLNGTFNYAEGEGTKHDRSSVMLLGQQEALMIATHAAAKKAGAKFVVVLLGSAVAASWAEANADAVLSAGYGGQEAGNAIWDVLLGSYNPSARLANTWPLNDTQLPPIGYYAMSPSDISPGRTYRYLDESRAPPLFRFAEGLRCANRLVLFAQLQCIAVGQSQARSCVHSYGNTTFHSLSTPASVSVCDPLTVSVSITHSGEGGDVVVTVFMEWLNASVRQSFTCIQRDRPLCGRISC